MKPQSDYCAPHLSSTDAVPRNVRPAARVAMAQRAEAGRNWSKRS